MDLEKIEGLVKIIEDSSLNEFTYKDKDVKITMSKLDHPPVVATGVPVAASAPVNSAYDLYPGAFCGKSRGRRGGKSVYHFSYRRNLLFCSCSGCTCFCKGGRSGKSRTDSVYSGSYEAYE